MPNKIEMMRMVEECLKTEEGIIPLYSKHIQNTLFLAGLDKEKEKKIRTILEKLRTDSERHRIIFQDLLDNIRRSDKDVY